MELTETHAEEILGRGEIALLGRLRASSNGAFLAQVCAAGDEVCAVYKPRRGERPLWDFPDGTLFAREVAAYELSRALDWGIVPVTVRRADGPLGEGALQRFVDHDPAHHYFNLLEHHADRFRAFAAFDVVANNSDRKGGHCLVDRERDVVVGIDHGLTFHAAWKLRTVIWDFAGEPVPAHLAEDLARVAADIESGAVGRHLAHLLAPPEVAAVTARIAALLEARRFPEPEPGYHSVPWPLL